MFVKFLLIITAVLPAHSYIDEIGHRHSKYECRNYQEPCGPNYSIPCCAENQKCVLIELLEQHYCIRNSGLGMDCEEDYDCVNDKAVCSKISQKCICEENYITRDNISCWPLLGGFCFTNDECEPNNSVCLNGECYCEYNFTPISKEECAKNYLELPCQEDEDCSDINHAMCSENKTCACRPNNIVSNKECRSLIGGYCNKDHDCIALNTLCINNECQCKRSFLPSANRECVLSYLNHVCEEDQDCYDIDRAMCSEEKKCICRPNHQTVDNSTCSSLIGGFCWLSSDCLPKNTFCMFDKCACMLEFKADETNYKCLRKLENFCELDEDCEEIRHAKCSKDKKCVCRDNNIALNDTCVPILGGFCWNDEPCAVNNSVCFDNECKCKAGFSFRSKTECVKGFFIAGEMAFLNETCKVSRQCFPENSRCVDNKCQCKVSFIPKPNDLCIPAMLGDPCEIDIDCAEVIHSMCSQNKKCICRPNNVQATSSRCIPLLGEFCWKNETCISSNSVCVDNICQCEDRYTAQSKYQCL